MGGWIKKEKDLREDPRVLRMATKLAKAYELRVTQERDDRHGGPLQGLAPWVSLVLGGLDQLWMHGDSFAREDDTLEATAEELDALVGIPGFCAAMPGDWLTQDLAGVVKLPDFGLKNGPAAKAAALNAQRAARYRDKQAASRSTVTGPLLDQTRQTDQTGERAQTPRASRLPPSFLLTPHRRGVALEHQIDPERTFKKFCMYWRSAEGPTATKRDWDRAWRDWVGRERPEPGAPKPAPSAEARAAAESDFERRRAASIAAVAPPSVPVGPPPPVVVPRGS